MIQIPGEIAEDYNKYYRYMQKNVHFQMKNGSVHTQEHAARVLLYVLLLAKREGLTPEDAELLAAAALFHDTRRIDDGFDVGHGRRGAEYYWEFCMSHSLPFWEVSYRIMEYHDRDDKLGEKAFALMGKEKEKGLQLYRIFKDADALDRYRLGPGKGALDERYLRTDAARELMGFAKKTVENWES